MTFVEIEETWEYPGAESFIVGMDLKEQFKQDFGYEIDEWDHESSDDELIVAFLEKMNGLYTLQYIGGSIGHFIITKIVPTISKLNIAEQTQ